MIPNATRWNLKMGSTEDGMVWFDGKKISPNDAREMAKALEFLAYRAFSQKSQSVDLIVLVAKKAS
jgi:ABC-type cobalamin/Fe3+-siderophores transport system ATPase subunit